MSGRDHLSGEQFQLFDPGPPEFEPGTWYHYSSSPDFDPDRGEPLHIGTPQAAGDRAGEVNMDTPVPDRPTHGWAHQFKIRSGSMENTRDNPVKDETANESQYYIKQGLYYKNAHEDRGSISAVVPRATSVEHIGMEPHFAVEVEEGSSSRTTRVGNQPTFSERKLFRTDAAERLRSTYDPVTERRR